MLEARNFFTLIDHTIFVNLFLTFYMITTVFTVNDYSK